METVQIVSIQKLLKNINTYIAEYLEVKGNLMYLKKEQIFNKEIQFAWRTSLRSIAKTFK